MTNSDKAHTTGKTGPAGKSASPSVNADQRKPDSRTSNDDTGKDDTGALEAAKQKLGEAGETVKHAASDVRSTAAQAAETAKAKAAKAASTVAEGVEEGYARVRSKAETAYRSSRSAANRTARSVKHRSVRTGQNIESYFEENPLMIGAAGFFGGLVLGSLLPRTRSEDRNLGRWRDEAARKGMAYGREFADNTAQRAEDLLVETRRKLEPDSEGAESPGYERPAYNGRS